jgi:hypothetical protein
MCLLLKISSWDYGKPGFRRFQLEREFSNVEEWERDFQERYAEIQALKALQS